jgi:hypothetical protein
MPTIILLHEIPDFQDVTNEKQETPLIVALKYPWIANSGMHLIEY